MTREQIKRIRGRGYGTEKELTLLLAAAERALVLEEVLAAARIVLSDIDDAWRRRLREVANG